MEPGSDENDLRAISFRYEGNSNRRTFLRSYPLHWGGEDENKQEEEQEEERGKVTEGGETSKPLKKIVISVFNWGEERTLFIRRFKHKLILSVIACLPVGFRPPTAMIKV